MSQMIFTGQTYNEEGSFSSSSPLDPYMIFNPVHNIEAQVRKLSSKRLRNQPTVTWRKLASRL